MTVATDSAKTGISRPATLLGASGVAVSHTGDTSETALATVTVPAGAMGLNGGLMIYSTWTSTSSANTKTYRVRLGGLAGTAFLNYAVSTTPTHHDIRRIRNRNSAASQVSSTAAGTSLAVGSTGSALTTGTVDTSTSQDIVFSAQLASAGETITLESYEVWLLP